MKAKSISSHLQRFFSGFALENISIYEVAFVKYQNYKIISSVTLFMGHGLASKRYHLFDKKLQNSCVFQNTLDIFDRSN